MPSRTGDTAEELVEQVFNAVVEMTSVERELWLDRWGMDLETSVRSEILVQVNRLLDAESEASKFGFLNEPVLNVGLVEADLKSGNPPVIEGYSIVRLLGEGGMGQVFLAIDEKLKSEVAVKIVREGLRFSESRRRFQAEAQLLARLNHPNIARVLSAGTAEGNIPFMVMEYVTGESITSFVNSQDLPISGRLELFRKVCLAVQYLHQNLIIHRDIKPGNILVNESGEPKLLDFGIAKLLDSTDAPDAQPNTVTRMMTPEYASPEQLAGETLTTASDVYSLGVLLFQILTGQRPSARSAKSASSAGAGDEKGPQKPSAVLVARADRNRRESGKPEAISTGSTGSRKIEILPHHLRGDLDNIVLMALRKEPQRRYASAAQFAEDIRRYEEGRTVSARKDSLWYRTTTFAKRNRVAVAVSMLALLILVVGTAVIGWEAHVARVQRERAERRFNDVRTLANSFMFEVNGAIQDVPGSLEARQVLAKRGLEYLDSLAREAENDNDLSSEVAKGYDEIGSITFDVAKALEFHSRALAINKRLVETVPSNKRYREQYGQSLEYMGDMDRENGHLEAALKTYQQCLAVREILVQMEPSNVEYRRLLSNGLIQIAYLDLQLGRTGSALANTDRSGQITDSIKDTGQNPTAEMEDRLTQFQLRSRIAFEEGDLSLSTVMSRNSLDVSGAELAADPQNARYLRSAWVCHFRNAMLQERIGDTTAAGKSLEVARGYIHDLSESDPGDRGHLRGVAITEVEIGKLYLTKGDARRALDQFRHALDISEGLYKADAQKAETHTDLARMHTLSAVAALRLGELDKATAELGLARQLFENELKASERNGLVLKGLAEVCFHAGELEEALSTKSKSPSDQGLHWKTTRAQFEQALGLWNEAKSRGDSTREVDDWIERTNKELERCNGLIGKP